MTISDTPYMLKQAERLIKSIKFFSKKKPTEFSIIIQGYDRSPIINPIPLPKIKIPNKYLSLNCDIHYCPYFWKLGAPCRWHINPKMDQCVFIDVDMIACNDLSPVYELDKNAIHGVTAFKTDILTDNQWDSLGISKKERLFYFNFGFIVVPSKKMKDIGDKMLKYYSWIAKEYNDYYAGQICLTYICKELGIKRNILETKFNYYDKLPIFDVNQILFLHYLSNRETIDKEEFESNACTKLVGDVIQKFSNIKFY